MDFDFSEEQNQLRDMLRRFVRKDYGFEARRAIIDSDEGISRDVWRQFAELGLLAIGIPEDYDGLGGDAVDTMIIMEELGRGLVVEPYVPTVVIGAGLIARAGTEAQQRAILPAVAGGECLLGLAHDEPQGRHQLNRVATVARREGDGWRLDGAKAVVLGGGCADRLIVSARTAGMVDDERGIALFLVDPNAPGVNVHRYMTHDGQRAADIRFENVTVSADDLLGDADGGLELLDHARDSAIAALCAEAVGIMDALLEATGEYLRTRKQFGTPIGSFQALQHRMADMLMHTEQARSISYLATAKLSADDADRRRALAAAKALVGQAARFVGQQAVQLHGGIGVTDELIVSHYFKRLTLINASFGDADHHLGRFSDMLAAARESA